MGQPRVFIGLREIAGYFGNLKKGFDEIGVKSAFLNLGGNHFKFETGNNPKWVIFFNNVGRKLGARFSNNFILRFLWLSTFQNFIGIFSFLFALPRYNVFVLGGNSTFFFFIDYIILKILRKKIIIVYLGSDSRPFYVNGFSGEAKGNSFLYRRIAWLQKRIVRFSERFADYVINHPPTALLQEKDFISWLQIGVPCKVPELMEKKNKDSNTIKIVHAPSKKGPKGTAYFEEIIEELKVKYQIEYIEISGMPHDEVIKTISKADIALDQFFSDTPMAIFATECSFQKVPVVVGSYYGDAIQKDYEISIIPPSVFAHPDNIKDEIEKLIVDTEYRLSCGERAYNFVSKNWGSAVVAKNYLKLIEDDFPKDWIFPIDKLNYIYGAAIEINALRERVNHFLDGKGLKYLQIDDKPVLKSAFKEFLNEKV